MNDSVDAVGSNAAQLRAARCSPQACISFCLFLSSINRRVENVAVKPTISFVLVYSLLRPNSDHREYPQRAVPVLRSNHIVISKLGLYSKPPNLYLFCAQRLQHSWRPAVLWRREWSVTGFWSILLEAAHSVMEKSDCGSIREQSNQEENNPLCGRLNRLEKTECKHRWGWERGRDILQLVAPTNPFKYIKEMNGMVVQFVFTLISY